MTITNTNNTYQTSFANDENNIPKIKNRCYSRGMSPLVVAGIITGIAIGVFQTVSERNYRHYNRSFDSSILTVGSIFIFALIILRCLGGKRRPGGGGSSDPWIPPTTTTYQEPFYNDTQSTNRFVPAQSSTPVNYNYNNTYPGYPDIGSSAPSYPGTNQYSVNPVHGSESRKESDNRFVRAQKS